MKRKTKYVLAAALLLPTLGGHPVFASGKSAITVSGFKAELQAFTLGGNGEGEAEYKLKTTPQGTNESFSSAFRHQEGRSRVQMSSAIRA